MKKKNSYLRKFIFGAIIISVLLLFGSSSKPTQSATYNIDSFVIIENRLSVEEIINNTLPTTSPIQTDDFIVITSPYGNRIHPFTKKLAFHKGIDISAKIGSPIYSTAKGVVAEAKYSKYGYGNKIVVEHNYGFETLYAHIDSIYVSVGDTINKNQQIGTVGNTGRSTGPHLHYEIKKNKVLIDPMVFYKYKTDELIDPMVFYAHMTTKCLSLE